MLEFIPNFNSRSKTRATVSRKDKTYSYNYKSPQRRYLCYGTQRERLPASASWL